MKTTLHSALVALLLAAPCGCSTPGLPRGAQLVGGGSRIFYEPPSAGTFILVEKHSKKVVETSSGNSTFQFDVTDEEDAKTLQSALGGDVPMNAELLLYFVPRGDQ